MIGKPKHSMYIFLTFHYLRERIKHQKKEGLPYAFLMMSLNTVVKQQLGNGFMIPCRAFDEGE
jgi:hypothetical protein